MNKAVFLDRDGVINEMVYYPDHGIIDSPFTVSQFKLLPGVGQAINVIHALGFLVILVSNQPGIAKGHFSRQTFQSIKRKMKIELGKEGTYLDAEYYCLHHPEAIKEDLKIVCECRKPKPGLLLQAATDNNIDLKKSWMVGDGLTDVQAGKNAGTNTIIIGSFKCELCKLAEQLKAYPDKVVPNLLEITHFL